MVGALVALAQHSQQESLQVGLLHLCSFFYLMSSKHLP
jgi:hypothetical protein